MTNQTDSTKKTITANSGFGNRQYTKEEFINSWMKPVYDVSTLLYGSEDKADKKLAANLPNKAKELASARFDRLYTQQEQEKETPSPGGEGRGEGETTQNS